MWAISIRDCGARGFFVIKAHFEADGLMQYRVSTDAEVPPLVAAERQMTSLAIQVEGLSGRIRRKTGCRNWPLAVNCMQLTSMTCPTNLPA